MNNHAILAYSSNPESGDGHGLQPCFFARVPFRIQTTGLWSQIRCKERCVRKTIENQIESAREVEPCGPLRSFVWTLYPHIMQWFNLRTNDFACSVLADFCRARETQKFVVVLVLVAYKNYFFQNGENHVNIIIASAFARWCLKHCKYRGFCYHWHKTSQIPWFLASEAPKTLVFTVCCAPIV